MFDDTEDQLRAYLSTVTKEEDKGFLRAIIQYGSKYGRPSFDVDSTTDRYHEIDIEQLRAANELFGKEKKIKLSKATLSLRLKGLVDMGVFTRSDDRIPGKPGRTSTYTLARLDEILDAPIPETKQTYLSKSERNADYYRELKIAEQAVIETDVQMLSIHDGQNQAYSERLVNNFIFACGRLSGRDPRKEVIETTYFFNKESINIVATQGGGTGIFTLDDQSTVLSIITLVIFTNDKRMAQNKEIRNEYFVDIVDLCKMCGLKPEGANRDSIRRSMDRLFFTNLNISCPTNSEFAEFFGITSFLDNGIHFTPDNFNFRFLWQYDSVSDMEPMQGCRKPVHYRISLHPVIYNQLLDKDAWNTFVVNPDLLKNRCKVVTLFYFCAARYIKREAGKVLSFKLKTLQQQLMPAVINYYDWQKSVVNDFRKFARLRGQEWNENGENTVEVYGYYIKLAPNSTNGYQITFWFNPNDPVIGKKNLMQKLLEQTIKHSLSEGDY